MIFLVAILLIVFVVASFLWIQNQPGWKQREYAERFKWYALCSGCAGVFAFILWILYKIWWFFFGSWIYEGPFASVTDSSDTCMFAGIYIFAVIYVIAGIIYVFKK